MEADDVVMLLGIYLAAIVLASLAATAAVAWHRSAERRRTRTRLRYAGLYADCLCDRIEYGRRTPFPALRRPGCRMLLAEMTASLCTVTSGTARERIAETVDECGLERVLWRRSRISGGWLRARSLQLLSQLPVSERCARRLAALEHAPDRYVRLYATLAGIAREPESLIARIGNLPGRLSAFELSELLMTLKHSGAPIACGAIIASSNPNLERLGFSLIRHFQLDGTRERVCELARSGDQAICREALCTLALLRGPISGVEQTVVALPERERRRIYRLLATQGYSLRALERFAKAEEGDRLEGYIPHIVEMRKRKIKV